MSAVQKWAPDAVLALAMVVAAVLWTDAQFTAFEAHDPQWGHDVAFFTQIFWSAVNGGPWASPILLEPQGMLEMVHFHPFFVALVPLFAIWPDSRFLLAFNVLVVVATALPLARLGEAASKHRGFGALCGLAWLVWLPVQSAALNDFRPLELMLPGLVLLALGVYRGRWVELVVGALLVCFTREESVYLLPFIGGALVVLPFGERRRVHGAAVLGIGVAWFLVLLAMKGNLFFHFDPTTWGQTTATPVPEHLVEGRTAFFLQVARSGYVLGLLAPVPLMLGAPPTVFLVLDTFREWERMTGPYVHVRVPTVAFLAVAGTVGAGWLARRDPRAVWPVGLALVVANALAFPDARERLGHRAASHAGILDSPEWVAREALLSDVTAEDRVGTDYGLMARLSGREVLWNVVHLYLEGGQPPHWTDAWPITADGLDVLVVMPDDPVLAHLGPEWTERRRGGGYLLLRRD
ncbi:MAG: DUF2079 domain-containing protein [Proteobacteria bacterium]|nr:DUF2079 domain-containing protein [Pseudomonadota bacterium]MCP4919404.1 DUF2079 domain-containing protein [Pseudomonadota bacterium]